MQILITTTDPKLTKDRLRRDFWASMPILTRFTPLRYAYWVEIYDWVDAEKRTLKLIIDYPPLQHQRIAGATADTVKALDLAIKARLGKTLKTYENTHIL